MARHSLECSITVIHKWVVQRRLQLNPDKTELTWFGGRTNLECLHSMDTTIRVRDVDIEPVDHIRDLGVLMDSPLTMRQHIAKVTSTCFSSSTASQAQPNTRRRRPEATCLCSNTNLR